jgi:hypothetical protein
VLDEFNRLFLLLPKFYVTIEGRGFATVSEKGEGRVFDVVNFGEESSGVSKDAETNH